jgi:DNA-directed RNA polymerase specialized sigma24 family protein
VDEECAADIAADLGMTPQAVRKAKSRVLARLRVLLREMGEEQ